tara:strand:+ start:160 stop:366 length:207 start_codon:yes stop_codon:yes gene_type:complete
MGAMSELHIELHNITDDGIESGFSGHRLREYVHDTAVNGYRIPNSLVQQFLKSTNVDSAEEEVFFDNE